MLAAAGSEQRYTVAVILYVKPEIYSAVICSAIRCVALDDEVIKRNMTGRQKSSCFFMALKIIGYSNVSFLNKRPLRF